MCTPALSSMTAATHSRARLGADSTTPTVACALNVTMTTMQPGPL
jgi:hypothetical protein